MTSSPTLDSTAIAACQSGVCRMSFFCLWAMQPESDVFSAMRAEGKADTMDSELIAGAGRDSSDEVARTLASIRTESGASLLGLAEASPVLLIFLRHFGCSFCRQAISDVADLKDELARRGVRPVFVHLGTPERAKPFFEYYGIGDVERVSDPEAKIYRDPMFALPRMHPALTLLQP